MLSGVNTRKKSQDGERTKYEEEVMLLQKESKSKTSPKNRPECLAGQVLAGQMQQIQIRKAAAE